MTTDLAALSAAATPISYVCSTLSGVWELRLAFGDTLKAKSEAEKWDRAYRTGNLVQIDREGMRERITLNIWHQLGQIEENVRAGQLTMEEVAVLADAAIAAILGGEHDRAV